MNINIYPDHPLRERISSFESYMFITERRFMGKHNAFPSHTLCVCDGNTKQDFLFNKLSERIAAKTYFESCMKKRTNHLPKGTDVGCFILYLESDSEEEDNDDFFYDVFCQLANVVAKFCKENDRVAAMVPHFHQGEDREHIHFLYQRSADEHDMLQDYITNELSE